RPMPAQVPAQVGAQVGASPGTGATLRLMLRRARWRLPAWVLGLSLLMAYFCTALGTVLDEDSLEGMAELALSPVTALVGGPGYGFDAVTVPRFLAGLYGPYLLLGCALMLMLTISRPLQPSSAPSRPRACRPWSCPAASAPPRLPLRWR